MELKRLKYIKNTGCLPKYGNGDSDVLKGATADTGTTSRWNNWGGVANAGTGLINAGASIYDAHLFTTTSDDYINKYGSINSNIDGIGYTKYNDINKSAERDIVSALNTKNTLMTTATGLGAGAALGTAILPGIGTAVGAGIGALGGLVGGLFGASSRKAKAEREMREAQLKVDNFNDMNRSDALTSSLQMKQAEKYGDTRSQTLFGYSSGKDELIDPATGETVNDYLVDTADGMSINKQNSFVSKGEGIWNPSTGAAHLVPHGPNDTARANLKPGDVVFGGETNPYTGNKFKDDAAPYIAAKEKINNMKPKGEGWLSKQTAETYNKAVSGLNSQIDQALSGLRDALRQVGLKSAHKQSLPGFEYGLDWWGNAIPSGVGMLASLGLYFQAKADKPYQPNTYVANRFLNKGLSTLDGLRVSPYPIMQQLRNAEARTNYAVNASGGLSTALKNLARISSLSGTQQQIGNMLQSVQLQNNAYKGAYANAMLQSGESEAARRQAARQYDLDYYSKAHGARQQMMLMGMYNFINNLNQYSANEFKRKSAIANLDLYALQLKTEQAKLDAWLKGQEKGDTVVNNWTGGVPYVLSPEIMDNIPGAINPPSQEYKPDPNLWNNLNKSKTSWVPTNNPLYKYWG